jgi:hypothetical protein
MVLSQHLPDGTQENLEALNKYSYVHYEISSKQ